MRIEPSHEKDACGVGFVAHIKGLRAHSIVEQGLKILENLESHVGTVQQPAQSSSMRKDFLLNPKSGAKPSPKS
jgi:hypothetical protein